MEGFSDLCRTSPRWVEGPEGVYHRSCYQTYTNNTLIKRLEAKREQVQFGQKPSGSGVPIEVHDSVRSSRSATPVPCAVSCIFCRQKQQRITGKRENLSQCLTKQASDKLLEAAEEKNYERILLKIRGEAFIAIDVKYHK